MPRSPIDAVITEILGLMYVRSRIHEGDKILVLYIKITPRLDLHLIHAVFPQIILPGNNLCHPHFFFLASLIYLEGLHFIYYTMVIVSLVKKKKIH